MALGLAPVSGTASVERVAAALGGRHVLLLLDNCEHLIDAAARMAEALLRASPAVCVIAISREPLRAAVEYVYRVPPLDVPDEDNLDVGDVLGHGAVRLFVARAQAAEPRYVLDRRLALPTVAICRHLDGMPLAIELAAARIAAFGVEGIAARLDDRFRLLTEGSRTALPRQQTLRATLDWSHELLSEPERVVLRRLSVFAGSFTLDAAAAIAASPEITGPDVVEYVANLVAESLVSADLGGAVTSYRLLETTRAYAREKLVESGEVDGFGRRHAEYQRNLFERAQSEWETQPTAQWLAAYGRELDNLRAALDWAFTPGGDAAIGVGLTTAAVPLWFQLSLLGECRARVERALSALAATPDRDAQRELQLQAALGGSLMYTTGPARETGAALGHRAATGGETSGHRLSVACIVGTLGQSHQQWGVPAGAAAGREIRRPGHEGERSLRSARRRSHARRRAPLPRGADPRARLHRAHAGALCRPREPIGRRALSIRPAGDRAHHPVTSAVAAGIRRPGHANGRRRHRRCARDPAHAVAVQRAGPGRVPLAIVTGDLSAADRYATMLVHNTARHGADVWQTYGR